MLNLAQRVALYRGRSGLSGIPLSELIAFLEGQLVLDQTQRVALYPGRSGLPGATLAEILAEVEAEAATGVTVNESVRVDDTAASSLSATLQLFPGSNRHFLCFFFLRDFTGAASAQNVATIDVGAQGFGTSNRQIVAEFTPTPFQRVEAWLLPESTISGGLPDTGTVDITANLSGATANKLAVMTVTQVSTVSAEFNATVQTNPFAWPNATVIDGEMLLIYASITVATPLLAIQNYAAGDVLPAFVSDTNSQTIVSVHNGTPPLAEGSTTYNEPGGFPPNFIIHCILRPV